MTKKQRGVLVAKKGRYGYLRKKPSIGIAIDAIISTPNGQTLTTILNRSFTKKRLIKWR